MSDLYHMEDVDWSRLGVVDVNGEEIGSLVEAPIAGTITVEHGVFIKTDEGHMLSPGTYQIVRKR